MTKTIRRPAFRLFWRRGEPQVWGTAAALALTLSLIAILLTVVLWNGLCVFWPRRIAEITLVNGTKLYGVIIRSSINEDTGRQSTQLKTANRDIDPNRQDFRWILCDDIREICYPENLYVIERQENGDAYGCLQGIELSGVQLHPTTNGDTQLVDAFNAVQHQYTDEIGPITLQLRTLGKQLETIRAELDSLRFKQLRNPNDPSQADLISKYEAESARIQRESDELVADQQARLAAIRSGNVILRNAQGDNFRTPLIDIVRFYQPNAMSLFAKVRHYFAKIGELLWANPRESNTEGGLFPAIFGTVMLIFLMAVFCFPLGVLAGIYLGEYAKEGFLVRIVRVAVNNLAGIPSIVYGIFGLGFFVYGIGGLIDSWLFPDRVAAGTPTFGTGGILWASLTLGLLTVPVVIVSTEEALRTIPRGIRESSLALGATKFQTLVRVLLPMASPGMMTGFILAMARAAGEVAPLMITGVVKLAPQLPIDGSPPFFHLDRKFMHLGFHIYDVGFQSPNVEASKPMVYVTTLLLLLIVLAMTSVAIYLRNRMRKRYLSRTI